MSEEKPSCDVGIFVLLIVATLFIPLVGLIVGSMNLKYPERNGQSILLIVIGIIMMLFNLHFLLSM